MMMRAVLLAREGYPAPNPHVGCVIVRDGVIVGEGYHDHAGGPHAEVVALQQAGAEAMGADIYVSLEPCAHIGRTGPCSDALIAARVKRVFVAVQDPNPQTAGNGMERLRRAGIEVIMWPKELAEMAIWVNRPFLGSWHGKVFVVGKLAATRDGFVARPDGTSKWITSEAARSVGHAIRAELGAVLVGRRTLEVDSPQLTARIPGVTNQPQRFVADRAARIPDDHPFFASGGQRLRGASPDELLQELRSLGVTGVLVEGGPNLVGSFIRDDLVDQLELFSSPDSWGQGIPMMCPETRQVFEANFRLRRSRPVERDFWHTWERFGEEESYQK